MDREENRRSSLLSMREWLPHSIRKHLELFEQLTDSNENANNNFFYLKFELARYHLNDLFCFRCKKSTSVIFIRNLGKIEIEKKRILKNTLPNIHDKQKDSTKREIKKLKENLRHIELAVAFLEGRGFKSIMAESPYSPHGSFHYRKTCEKICSYVNLGVLHEIQQKQPSIHHKKLYEKFSFTTNDIEKWIAKNEFRKDMMYPYYYTEVSKNMKPFIKRPRKGVCVNL